MGVVLGTKKAASPLEVYTILALGQQLGMTHTMAMQSICIVNGRLSIYGDGALALCRASGKFDEEAFEEKLVGDGDNLKAICTVRRLPNGKPVTREFSLAEAKKAGLLSKDNWRNYERRMLQMRARAWAIRDAFTDILCGMCIAEEAEEREVKSISYTVSEALTRLDPLKKGE